MSIPVSVMCRCPLCNFLNQYKSLEADGLYNHTELVRCDQEEGGCGEQFVLTYKVGISAAVAPIGEWTEAKL